MNLTRFQTLENGKTTRTNDIIGKLKKPGIHTETNFLNNFVITAQIKAYGCFSRLDKKKMPIGFLIGWCSLCQFVDLSEQYVVFIFRIAVSKLQVKTFLITKSALYIAGNVSSGNY